MAEFDRMALQGVTEENAAVVYALLYLGQQLEEHNAQFTKLVQLAQEGRDAWDASVEGGKHADQR